MDTLFFFLVGMLLAGGGAVLAIIAHDRSCERSTQLARCSGDE